MMARPVSNGNSMVESDTPGKPRKFSGATGWKNATALRRLSSSNTGQNFGAADVLAAVVAHHHHAVGA